MTLMPSIAVAQEPSESAEEISVEVESSVPDAESTQGWVRTRVVETVERFPQPLERGDSIRVRVSGTLFDYRLEVVLSHRGDALTVADQPREWVCACGSDEMIEQVGGAVEEAGRALAEFTAWERREAKREAEAAAAAARAQAERERVAAERLDAELQRYRPTKLGRVGIGVLGVGGAVTFSGIIMAAKGDLVVEDQMMVRRRWAGPGAALLGVGVAAMVGGAAALVIDVVGCRRGHERCRSRAAVGPALGRWAWQGRDGGTR